MFSSLRSSFLRVKCVGMKNVYQYMEKTLSHLKLSAVQIFHLPICIYMSSSSSKSKSSMINIDPHERKKLILWLEHCRYNGLPIPDKIKEEDIQDLITMNEYRRFKYINNMFIKEHKKAIKERKKEKLKEYVTKLKEDRGKLQPHHIQYGLWQNSIFIKVSRQIIKNFHYHRLISALKYKQPTIIDLSYTKFMNKNESKILAEHLKMSIIRNEEDLNPLNLTFCNVDFESLIMKHMKSSPFNIENIPMNVVSENYMNLYPKEKLVYLSPNARDEMKTFDSNAIYIIGGIVERGCILPHTLSKAKEEGLKVQKFPLDRYHIFKGQKALDTHIVVSILLDLQNTGNWKKAFENIPSQLIQTATESHNKASIKRKRDSWYLKSSNNI